MDQAFVYRQLALAQEQGLSIEIARHPGERARSLIGLARAHSYPGAGNRMTGMFASIVSENPNSDLLILVAWHWREFCGFAAIEAFEPFEFLLCCSARPGLGTGTALMVAACAAFGGRPFNGVTDPSVSGFPELLGWKSRGEALLLAPDESRRLSALATRFQLEPAPRPELQVINCKE